MSDSDGAAVPDACISLTPASGAAGRSVTAVQDGTFLLDQLPFGAYRMEVARSGFETWRGVIEVHDGEAPGLAVVLHAASVSSSLNVSSSAHEVAEAQLQLEEKQRVLGVFPNFYASYAPDPEPLSGREKFRLGWRFAADPVAFSVAGIVAASEQRAGTFQGYGPGARGYFKRYGAAYTDGLTSTMFGQALLPAVLHQDPRYFVKGTGSKSSRVMYALASAVLCKGDSRRWQLNYSNVLGNFASAGLSNAYYPSANRGAELVLQNALTATAMGSLGGLFQEFLLHRMTPGIPDYANAGN